MSKAAQIDRVSYAVAGGTANAIVAALFPVPASLASLEGCIFRLKTGGAANGSGGVTLNLNGFGMKALTRLDGSALKPGDIPANSVISIATDGTHLFLIAAGSATQPVANGVVLFSNPGTFPWVCPAGITKTRAKVWAAGGGGGGTVSTAGSVATSAGGGGYVEKLIDVVPGTTYNVIVGAGGAGGNATSPSNGGAGGTSSFGAFISATGGGGGIAANGAIQTSPGAGGAGTGGDLNVGGGGGGIGYPVSASFVLPPGGYSFQCAANQQVITGISVTGRAGIFPGGGAGGGALGGPGGVGAGGLVILEF
jgi:hypothetical protein